MDRTKVNLLNKSRKYNYFWKTTYIILSTCEGIMFSQRRNIDKLYNCEENSSMRLDDDEHKNSRYSKIYVI